MNALEVLSIIFSNDVNEKEYNKNLLSKDVIDFFKVNHFSWLYASLVKNVNCRKELPHDGYELIRKDELKKRQQKALIFELKSIIEYFNKHSINYLIVKGPVLSFQLYNNPTKRSYKDIDILLPNFCDDILEVLNFFKQSDYFQNFGWNNKSSINLQQIVYGERFDHHEIVCTKGINDMYKFELKKALSSIPTEIIHEFMDNTAVYNIDGISIKSFDLTYSFIALCSNVFINSESRSAIYYNTSSIRHYYDLFTFIKKYKDVLNKTDINELTKRLNLSLRVERVLSNLVQILTYNEQVKQTNINIIEWCEKISNIKKVIPATPLYGDIFLENKLTNFELIDWRKSYVERLFFDNTVNMICDYKNSISNNQLAEINDKKHSFAYVNVKKYNNVYYLTVDRVESDPFFYKIEFLLNTRSDKMFVGFILSEDSIKCGNSCVFFSNAKHYDSIVEDNVTVNIKGKYIECDITKLIFMSIQENGKVIMRLSKVIPTINEMYQELESISCQYLVG